jgi:hypothetical protein
MLGDTEREPQIVQFGLGRVRLVTVLKVMSSTTALSRD